MSIKCTLGGFAERARATSEEGRLPQSKNVKGGMSGDQKAESK